MIEDGSKSMDAKKIKNYQKSGFYNIFRADRQLYPFWPAE
jgi:hypothetical protein